MSVTIENLVTSGTFSLDGGTWDVDNNVWIGAYDEGVRLVGPNAPTVTAPPIGDTDRHGNLSEAPWAKA